MQLEEFLRQEAEKAQEAFRTWTEDADSPVPWFAGLKLVSLSFRNGDAVFVWHDPTDDTYHGWRWKVATLLDLELSEDLETTEPTEPDENGIRWWGLRDG